MFHKIKEIKPLEGYCLQALFFNGIQKEFDVKKMMNTHKEFLSLKDTALFNNIKVIDNGYAVAWNEHIDLECETIYNEGTTLSAVVPDTK